jgi:hypothetical protein
MSDVVVPVFRNGRIEPSVNYDKYFNSDGSEFTNLFNVNNWISLNATYVSATSISITCPNETNTDYIINKLVGKLFTCLSANNSERIYGYIKSVSRTTTTATITLVCSADITNTHHLFKFAVNRSINQYKHLVTIPSEIIADSSFAQGMFYYTKFISIMLPVDTYLQTAAAGTGAACAWNVYDDGSALYSAAQDMTTNLTLLERRPTTNYITAGSLINLRITNVGGTTKPQNFQAVMYIVPQAEFTDFTL